MQDAQHHQPVWLDHVPAPSHPRLSRDRGADVVVVGAGLTGLTAALLLQREGLTVVLLERHRVARAATAHTSGHLTAVPDVPVQTLVSRFGEAGAHVAVQAGLAAVDTVESLGRELGADAGFQRVPAFRYAETAGDVDELRREALAAVRIGLPAAMVEATPLPFRIAAAIRFEDQALFHPLRYAQALARAFTAAGGALFEESAVLDVQPGEPCVVSCERHVVRARFVVHATQTPPGRVVPVQARLAPVTSYVVVARLPEPAPIGLFWSNADPYHYLRPLAPGSELLLAGGADHKTGQPGGHDGFGELEAHVGARFAVRAIERRWSFGLFEPADGLPYVGRLGDDPVWVAAGFAGAGLAWGTAAAQLVRDQILGRSHALGELLDVTRVKPLASAGEVVRETADNAWHLVRDRLARPEARDLADVAPGEGRLVQVDGHRAAVHRDGDGRLHVLSPTCTHLGCIVHWNEAAATWDCPCPGGRFLPDGSVLYGPPTRPLPSAEAVHAPLRTTLPPAAEAGGAAVA